MLLHNFQLTPQEVVAHGNAWYLLVTRTTLACFESRYLQKDVDHQHLEAYPASKLCVWNLIVRQGEARIESFHPAILFLFLLSLARSTLGSPCFLSQLAKTRCKDIRNYGCHGFFQLRHPRLLFESWQSARILPVVAQLTTTNNMNGLNPQY